MEVSAVKLRESYQIYFVDTNNLFVKQNSLCVVETEHGVDLGYVVKSMRYQNNPGIDIKGKLIRITNADDNKTIKDIEILEKKAFESCREKARAKKLDMKLISVKCLFDRTKIIFYFVAENRIDFRDLVRELASVFKTRIEMRQIGVRDEARLVGGFGPCGRSLCCLHLRDEFDPVSIKMAKEQDLNLNSLKISGMCGRLLCCLGYEYKTYMSLNENLPKHGMEIFAEKKVYTVYSSDTLKESITLKIGDRFVKISKYDLVIKDNKYTIKDEIIDKIIKADDESVADSHEGF